MRDMRKASITIGGIYMHYKGMRVKVLSVALHSETKDPMVVYIHLEDGQEWVRPLAMFCEDIILEGKKQPRFQLET